MKQVCIMCLAVVMVSGCGSQSPITEPGPTKGPVEIVKPRNSNIPVEVSYPVIKDEEDGSFKRMVDVQLNMKVSPAVLREIALEVKAAEKHQYERTFIFVYLPQVVFDAQRDPWATCHFNPTLEVKILGLTKEGEESLRKRPLIHPGKLIGAWIIDDQFIGHLHMIYDTGGKAMEATLSPGGGRFDGEMIELPSVGGKRRFQLVESTEIQEVDTDGTLRMINKEGEVFCAARPMK